MPASTSPGTSSTLENTPQDEPSPLPPSKKRKSTSTSRGVASLTPEQLAKKRANDREAQRAIRERTKAQIETLEKRITELTSQQPYQELQAALRQRNAIQAENEEIRRRLASVLAIIQPCVGSQSSGVLPNVTQQPVHYGLSQPNGTFSPDQLQNPTGSRSLNDASAHAHPHVSPESTPSYQASYSSGDGLTSNERMWQSSRSDLDHQKDHLSRNLDLNGTERLSFNFLLDGNKRPPSIPPREGNINPLSHTHLQDTSAPFLGPSQAPWLMLPKHVAPTSPLDNILLKFLTSRQHDRDHHHSPNPAYPSVCSLLNPTTNINVDPLSQLMTDIISKFPGICGLPEQVATLFGMFILMRWMVHPTLSNFERIPDWLRPRRSQIYTQHPIWVDFLPFPRMRDKVVADHHSYPFENWFIPFTSGLSVNWPYEPTDCLLCAPDQDEPFINPVFERHITRLENWSVGQGFVEAFPKLRDTVRVTVGREKHIGIGHTP